MISSASSTPSSGSPLPLSSFTAKPDSRPEMLGADQLALGKTSDLREAISQEPEIRADVVARAEALARDPDYPSLQVLRDVASRLLASPDLSEQAD